ncbi:MAG: Carbon storage regulator, partial [uncultured Solirubrobacteraceae bacterium]
AHHHPSRRREAHDRRGRRRRDPRDRRQPGPRRHPGPPVGPRVPRGDLDGGQGGEPRCGDRRPRGASRPRRQLEV